MGWTKNREVQCGCGWEGSSLGTTQMVKMVDDQKLGIYFAAFKWACPICRADVTSQVCLAGLSITYHDLPEVKGKFLKRYVKKQLNEDYYETHIIG